MENIKIAPPPLARRERSLQITDTDATSIKINQPIKSQQHSVGNSGILGCTGEAEVVAQTLIRSEKKTMYK